MSREKKMIREGGMLTKRKTPGFDLRQEEDIEWSGVSERDRRVHPVLSSAFAHLHRNGAKGKQVTPELMTTAYREVGDYVFKVFGKTGVVGVIDLQLHPELKGKGVDEIRNLEHGRIVFYKFDKGEFKRLARSADGNSTGAEIAETLCKLFPEIFGNGLKGGSPSSLNELCTAVGVKPRDAVRVMSSMEIGFEIAFKRLNASN